MHSTGAPATVHSLRRASAQQQLLLFVSVFFLIWSLRATVFYFIDESIGSYVYRTTYSTLIKTLLWLVPAIGFVYLCRRPPSSEYLGISEIGDEKAWRDSLMLTAVFLGSVAVFEIGAGRRVFSFNEIALVPVGLFLLSFLIAPLVEEILFRGLLMKEFLKYFRPALAILINSLLFMGIHLPFWISMQGLTPEVLQNAIGVFIFSVIACVLYARSRSVWPPTIAHIGNNLLAMMLVPA
jgi:uncharacterized protein